MHGLGIAQRVEEESGGVIHLGPGTLYRSLDDMQAEGLIDRAKPPSLDADPRRKFYRMTPRGKRVLRLEMERLHRLVEQAKARKVLPEKA